MLAWVEFFLSQGITIGDAEMVVDLLCRASQVAASVGWSLRARALQIILRFDSEMEV